MSEQNNSPTKAVIYCRVSSTKQIEEGHGLQSQETRCRQYAEGKGYEVEAVFPDGVSGGGNFLLRPGMVALIAYLDAQPDQNYVVIFDDLKRFARDTEFHMKLRRELTARSATVECLNFKFEDSPEGRFIETILAAQGELERAQNGRQVYQKMKARLTNGYWCFPAPSGYRFEKTKEHGKLLVRDEPMASIVQEAFERLASGSLQTTTEVTSFLATQAGWKNNRAPQVNYQTISDLLRRPIYAGYLTMPKWGVALQPAKHEGLVSFEVWQRAQDRLDRKSYAPMRKDINLDFPLRGFIECIDCSYPLTGAWSKSRCGTKHPYYRCSNSKCESYSKSIRKARLEEEFETVIKTLRPNDGIFALYTRMFKDAWDQRSAQASQNAVLFKDKVQQIEKKIDQLLERIVNSETPTVIKAYETKIASLEKEKLIAMEKASSGAKPKINFDSMFELALKFLQKPEKLWDSGVFELQRLVLRLAFSDRMVYCRKTGTLNTKLSLPFKMLTTSHEQNPRMVGGTGIEPVTPCVSSKCSTPELTAPPLGMVII